MQRPWPGHKAPVRLLLDVPVQEERKSTGLPVGILLSTPCMCLGPNLLSKAARHQRMFAQVFLHQIQLSGQGMPIAPLRIPSQVQGLRLLFTRSTCQSLTCHWGASSNEV